MKRNTKIMQLLAALAITVFALAGCGNNGSTSAGFAADNEIGVLSREDGSGTRGAFIELFAIEQKDANGEKVDYTTPQAIVTDSTAVMMTTVAGDLYAIGYISLGSMNDTVKGLAIDGAAPTVANIQNGSYKVVRPFNIVNQGQLSPAAQDFVDFIMSADGQAVVAENGYIPTEAAAPAYSGSVSEGKITLSGSSSVTPVMEKLKEAYLLKNPNVTLEIQQSDSTTGITNALDGSCDIGMASRELKESESAQGLQSLTIAQDGIVVIVNQQNPLTGLSAEHVRAIFTGETTSWSAVLE